MEMLRGTHVPIDVYEHIHSGVALGLRLAVLESEHSFQASLSHMQSWCALHGHPSADLKATVGVLKTLFAGSLACIPYLTGGRSAEEFANDDRKQAIDEYKRLRSTMKEKGGVEKVEEAAPRLVGKRR